MSYDNGGYPIDYDDSAHQINILSETINKLKDEIISLKKQISAKDTLIKSLKSDYIIKKEAEINALKEANNHLKNDFKKLLKQLEDQSTIEAGEKAILDRVYKYIEIVDRQDTQFTQLYQLDFIPSCYRLVITKTVRDYLISKGVKDKSE